MAKAWILGVFGSIGLAAAAASAAAAPEGGSATSAARVYRFDLARNFFATPTQEVADRSQLFAAIDELNRLAAKVVTRDDLIAAMIADDRAQRLFRKHDLYLFLRFAVDTREGAGLEDADAMRARLRAARATLKRRALANGDAWFDAGSLNTPEFARYGFWFAQAKREQDHQLPPEQQAVVDALEPLIGGGSYPGLVGNLAFEPVVVGRRQLDPRRNRSELQSNESPEIRRAASRQLLAGYAAKRDQLAELLVRAAKGQDALARLHKHDGAMEEAAFNAYVTPSQYRTLLTDVAQHAPVFKQWKAKVRDPFSVSAHWQPRAAANDIARSARAISPRYAAEFVALLNPANGRADLAGDGQRVPMQGAASVYPIGVSTIYMQEYQGDLLDLVILAHESGHAVQAQLMYRGSVPMAYATGPGYFTESFGRFQELVLLDELYRSTRDGPRKMLLRDALAARLLSVFNSAEEAAIELALHDAVRNGKASADDLDAATAKASAAYSTTVADQPEMRGVWMMSDGYYMAPFQELNDAFASLLAVRYYQLYRRDRASFGSRYMALLSGGYGESPSKLLSGHLGIDMTDPQFVTATMVALKQEIDALNQP